MKIIHKDGWWWIQDPVGQLHGPYISRKGAEEALKEESRGFQLQPEIGGEG